MRLITRLIALAALLWLALLFTGYGILIGNHENLAGLGLKCRYLTARQIISAQYVHSESGIMGVSQCPLLRKSNSVIEN